MKKKVLMILTVLIMSLLSVSGLVACVNNDDADENTNGEAKVSYTITFIAEDKIVGKVTYTADNKSIIEPNVPKKDGYIGEWEKYDLNEKDITVNAIYTAIIYTKNLTFSFNNNQYTLTGYEGTDKDIFIPSVYEGYPVTSIGANAFNERSEINSITMPDSVTSIGEQAFYECSGIDNIEIPNSVTSIGERAFYGCNGLTKIKIPNSVLYMGSEAFGACRGLVAQCEVGNKPISWDKNWNYYDGIICYVIWNCNSNDVAEDGNIYYTADNGILYALKDNIATIANQSLQLTGKLNVPSVVTYGGVDYQVKNIGDMAFAYCDMIDSIILPNSVTNISDLAFLYCIKISYLKIGNGVKNIGSEVFYGSNNLLDIEFNGKIAEWQSINKGLEWKDGTGDFTLKCSDGTLSKAEA